MDFRNDFDCLDYFRLLFYDGAEMLFPSIFKGD